MELNTREKRDAYAKWFEAWWDEDFSIAGPKKGTYYEKNKSIDAIETFPLSWKGETRQFPKIYFPLFDGNCEPTPKHPDFDAKGTWAASALRSLRHEGTFGQVFKDTFSKASNTAEGIADGIIFPETLDLSGKDSVSISMRLASMPKSLFLRRQTPRTLSAWTKADFSGAIFPAGLELNAIQFNKKTIFGECLFLGKVSFGRARFAGEVHFQNAAFYELASFDGIEFAALALFNAAVFHEEVRFRGYDKYITGEPPSQFHVCSFRNTEFRSEVLFHNRVFRDKTDFQGACFHRAPKFHKCELHQDTSFPNRAAFLERYSVGNNDRNREIERAYRTLRLEMEKVGSRNEEVMFHSFELEARSHRKDAEVSIVERVFIRLYGFVSKYGQSLSRPLELLCWTAVFSMAGFVWLAVPATHSMLSVRYSIPSLDHAAEISIFSLKQIFRPFHIWGDGFDRYLSSAAAPQWLIEINDKHPLLLRLFATLESASAVILIALFFIVLRRKFQLS